MKFLAAFLMIFMSLPSFANNPERMMVMACQERLPGTTTLNNLVLVVEQLQGDGGRLLNREQHPTSTDEVDTVARFYRGDLQTQSLEEVAQQANLFHEVHGRASRLTKDKMVFFAMDDGHQSAMEVFLNELNRTTYIRTDGLIGLLLNCNEPTSLAEAFPNRPDVQQAMNPQGDGGVIDTTSLEVDGDGAGTIEPNSI